MAQQQPKQQSHWTPSWIAIIAALAMLAIVDAERTRVLPMSWWALPFIAVAGGVATWIITLVQQAWRRTHIYRAASWLAAGTWTTWATLAGLDQVAWLTLIGGTAILAGLAYLCRTPRPEPAGAPGEMLEPTGELFERRPRTVIVWETLLRHLTKGHLVVTKIVPWDKPEDGESIHIRLPAGGDLTPQSLADICPKIAVARRLPHGCGARVLDGEHQGEAVIDVMLRDCLTDSITVDDDFSPVSVYDQFQVMTTPRGESLEVCLRSQSMVIGGAPDAGKTTLLHRIMLWLARCVDALIWVADTNGGGVATPFVRPWALGKAGRPLVDWVGADEAEVAVMVAVAAAIMKDRKTAPAAVQRRHDADTTVLPVDRDLPAVVILNDEGGELRQAVSLLGQLADQGLSRLAQIGRAEGGRVVKSVLRGTSDLLDKALRVNAAIRICLRMEEEDEYGHVLGTNPGKTKLLHKGAGYMRRPGDPRPILGRTVNVLLSQIERAAVACADLRPDLDERAQQVAARVRVRDVLGGREPAPEIMALRVMQDVEAGRAYSGRWDRFAGRLAAMRGEDAPELEAATPTVAEATTSVAPAGSALAALSAAAGTAKPAPPAAPAPTSTEPAGKTEAPKVGKTGPAKVAIDLQDRTSVDREAKRLITDWMADETSSPVSAAPPDAVRAAPKTTTREHILAVLRDAYPDMLTSGQIGVALNERRAAVSRTYRQDVLKQMREAGDVIQARSAYGLPPR